MKKDQELTVITKTYDQVFHGVSIVAMAVGWSRWCGASVIAVGGEQPASVPSIHEACWEHAPARLWPSSWACLWPCGLWPGKPQPPSAAGTRRCPQDSAHGTATTPRAAVP